MTLKAIIAERIYTLEKPEEYHNAMILKDDRIDSFVTINDIENNTNKFDKVFRFDNCFILPGFIDSHIHVLSFGRSLKILNLKNILSKVELLKKIKGEVNKTSKKDKWILGFGWDQSLFIEKSYPTRFDIDSVSEEHPVVLTRAGGHIIVANSKAIEIAQITPNTNEPTGGIIDKSNSGNLTGIFREKAIDLILQHVPIQSILEKQNNLKTAMRILNSKGITSVQSNDAFNYDIYKSMHKELTLRVYFTPSIDEIKFLSKNGVIKSGVGDNFLRFGRAKIFSDGSLGGETAALIEPYKNSLNKGKLIYSTIELRKLIKMAFKLGWQIETHAIGDRAAEEVINAYESILHKGSRPILTHCQVLNKELIMRIAKNDIIANIQPIFIDSDMEWAEDRLGSLRMKYSYAWRSLLEMGVQCVGGSDAPIESPNPFYGIYAAVTRKNLNNIPVNGWFSKEKLSIWQALKLYSDGAYAEFAEQEKGRILPGMLADFVVLDKDIFNVKPEEIKELKVISTFVGGKIVWQHSVKN